MSNLGERNNSDKMYTYFLCAKLYAIATLYGWIHVNMCALNCCWHTALLWWICCRKSETLYIWELSRSTHSRYICILGFSPADLPQSWGVLCSWFHGFSRMQIFVFNWEDFIALCGFLASAVYLVILYSSCWSEAYFLCWTEITSYRTATSHPSGDQLTTSQCPSSNC